MSKLHRLRLLTTICIIALFIFASHANALFDSNLDKAKEFMQAGMYPQAIALLEKEINDSPTNAEAQFQLGICYINQNNYSSADERFTSAVRLNSNYGYKIGTEYKKAAEYNLNKGILSSVRSLYNKSIEYDPSLKMDIAQKLFQDGKQNNNDQVFSLAVSYDNSLSNDIADHYYSLSQNSQGDDRLSYLSKASRYNDKYRKEIEDAKLKIGYSFLNAAKKYAKIPGKEEETKINKEKASQYLSIKIVQDELPAYKIYPPRQEPYVFTIEPCERIDHSIKFPKGVKVKYMFRGKNPNFSIDYGNGEIINVWESKGESMPTKTDSAIVIKARCINSKTLITKMVVSKK